MQNTLIFLKGLIPKLREWKNELVFYVGAGLTVATAVLQVVDATEVDDLPGWAALVPVVTTLIARGFNTGPVTAANAGPVSAPEG